MTSTRWRYKFRGPYFAIARGVRTSAHRLSPHRAFLITSLLVLVALNCISSLQVLNLAGLDDLVLGYLIEGAATATTPSRSDFRLLLSTDRRMREHRGTDAVVIRRLVDAGARAIVMDWVPVGESPHDQELAKAIKYAGQRGCAVILGAFEFQRVRNRILPRDAASFANLLEPDSERHFGLVRLKAQPAGWIRPTWWRYRLKQNSANVGLVDSLALRAYLAARGCLASSWDSRSQQLVLQCADGSRRSESLPLVGDAELLVPFPQPDRYESIRTTVDYSELAKGAALEGEEVSGTTVIVAFEDPTDSRAIRDGEKEYGYLYHVNALTALTSGAYLRTVNFGTNCVLLFLLFCLGVIAKRSKTIWPHEVVSLEVFREGLPPISVGLLLVLLLYAIFAYKLVSLANTVLSINYHIMAIVAGHASGHKLQAQLNEPPILVIPGGVSL